MPKKLCRYNNKHKFDTDDALLQHEKYCPDKSKRTDLKECPFSNKHIVLTKQYEKHIKICKYRPKNTPQKEEQKNKENNNINAEVINDEKNKKIEDWELKVDEWIDDSVKKDECLKRKVETTDFSVAGQTPDTCCHYETSYKVGGQKISTSVCSAYEKSKVEDYMKTLKKEQDVYKAASKALGYSDIKYSLDCSSSYIKF